MTHNWNGYETGGNVRDLLISPPAYENVEDYNPDDMIFGLILILH
jgi:hypothetical protein